MTDEEKRIFEKWFEEKKENCEVYGNGDDFWVDDEIKKFCLMGYELGLKAGRPQWHKVADELPKEDDVYLIYTTEGYLLGHYEQGGADGKIDFCGEPYSDFTEYPSEEELMENDVIAWCGIPTFDKEK